MVSLQHLKAATVLLDLTVASDLAISREGPCNARGLVRRQRGKGRFLLRPDPLLNEILGALARAKRR